MERLYQSPENSFGKIFPGWAAFLGNGKTKPKRKEEWVPVAESMARDNGGKLQSMNWLEHNGYCGLAIAMRKQPDLFAHITQDKPSAHLKSPEQWVPIAEEMARNNNGELPGYMWLAKNGYSGLTGAMWKRPELFGDSATESNQ